MNVKKILISQNKYNYQIDYNFCSLGPKVNCREWLVYWSGKVTEAKKQGLLKKQLESILSLGGVVYYKEQASINQIPLIFLTKSSFLKCTSSNH